MRKLSQNAIAVTCEICGKEFKREPYEVREHIYCSRQCMAKGQIRARAVRCEVCGKEFQRTNWLLKSKHIYCSHDCYAVIRKAKFKQGGENHPQWKGGKESRKCLQCGISFIPKRRSLKENRNQFCSMQCKGIWQKPMVQGSANGNWKGTAIKQHCLICKAEFTTKPYFIERGWGKLCSDRCKGIYNMSNPTRFANTSIERRMKEILGAANIPFEHQVRIKNIAIVDFLLPDNLVVEADGEWFHSWAGRKEKDELRDSRLKKEGYKVMRFVDKEINQYPDRVCTQIQAHLQGYN